MKKLMMLVLAVSTAATLAACGGGGGGNATAAMPSAGGKTVSAQEIGGTGNVLVDSSGMALYASDQETAAGKALCTGACNSFWTPVTVNGGVPNGGSLPGKLGVAKRPDGTKQVTYNGKLLYTFTQDQSGEVTGDGFQDAFNGQQFTWHVVSAANNGGSPSAGSTASNTSGGVTY
ncbi:MAG: COG4315 family predicted lipoprotein [Solirubrobacterales bacterium]